MASLPFQNKYAHRTASKESSCFVCGKFTTAVFTHKDIDWFYVCVNHINDTSFCKPVNPPAPPAQTPAVVPTKKPLAKPVKQEDTKTDKKQPDDSKDAPKDAKPEESKKKEEEELKPAVIEPPKPAVPAGPKEYILDSKIFYLRENEYKRKLTQKKAKQVAAQFPKVPSSFPSLPK